MKEKFEEQIRRAFEDSTQNEREPLPGHEERFEMRLLKLKNAQKMRRIPPWIWMAAASVVTAVFIVYMVAGEMKKTNEIADRARLSDVSVEMAAVEAFYNDKLRIDQQGLNTSDPAIMKFLQDIERLEQEYKKLEEKLNENFNNERIVKAMVSNYKYRLQLLEQLQKYIEIQNELNTGKHEQKLSS
jgi:hypothetical protein